MSLDTIKLSPYLVKEMYLNTLVEDAGTKPKTRTSPAAKVSPGGNTSAAGEILFLGENIKHILIIVRNPDQAFVSDADYDFLASILHACKLSVGDVALVNCHNNPLAVYENLNAQFTPNIVLFIGTEPQDLGFPVQIPRYRIQQYNGQQYVSAPSLTELSADKEAKKQLWLALKQLFSV